MLIFVIFIIFIFILFIPLPLKFLIYFSKEEYFIKFYNLNLFSKDDGLIKKFLKKKKSSSKSTNNDSNKNNKEDEKEKNSKDKKKHTKLPLKKLYKTIKSNKFKPSIKYDGKISYSLNDAANTAISYGWINNLNPILLNVLGIVFKIKKFKNLFNPIFKDEIICELSISCIITFNLAQIIYIVFLILKCLLKNKEVFPK